jgi:hypothetical protein
MVIVGQFVDDHHVWLFVPISVSNCNENRPPAAAAKNLRSFEGTVALAKEYGDNTGRCTRFSFEGAKTGYELSHSFRRG